MDKVNARLRVLLAEDDPDSLDAFSTLLEMDGHTVKAVTDGRQALEALSHFQPDVAIVDIGKPQLDGYRVAERISAHRPNVRLVAVTGWSQTEHIERSRRAGFHYQLSRPLAPSALRHILGEIRSGT